MISKSTYQCIAMVFILNLHTDQSKFANFKLVTDTGSHVTLRIHLIHSTPTFDTLFSIIILLLVMIIILLLVMAGYECHKLFNGPVVDCGQGPLYWYFDLRGQRTTSE